MPGRSESEAGCNTVINKRIRISTDGFGKLREADGYSAADKSDAVQGKTYPLGFLPGRRCKYPRLNQGASQ